RDGFVIREPDAADRRMVTVKLTAAGARFMNELLPEHFRLINALMAALSENERKTLVRLLAKIIAGSSQPAAGACTHFSISSQPTVILKKIILTLLVLIVFVGVLIGLKGLQFKAMKASEAAAQLPPESVSTAEVKAVVWKPFFSAIGSVA